MSNARTRIIALATVLVLALAALAAYAAMSAVAQGNQYGHDKVVICHKPGTPAEKTMEVPPPAVPGHLGHGDYLGPCQDDEGTGTGGGTTVVTPPEETTPDTTVVDPTVPAPDDTTVYIPPEPTTPDNGGTTVAPPEETTGPEPTQPDMTIDVSLDHVCTVEPGLERITLTNENDFAIAGVLTPANEQSEHNQPFELDAGQSLTTEMFVSQGAMPVVKVLVRGEVVESIEIRQNPCGGETSPPGDTTDGGETTDTGRTDRQDIGTPTSGETTSETTEPGNVNGSPAPADGGEATGTSEGEPAVNADASGSGEATLVDEPAGAGSGARSDGVAQLGKSGQLPDTGGARLTTLGAGALLLGGGLLARRLLK